MNFKDIPKNDIIQFLLMNNISYDINDNIYNVAIQHINDDDIIYNSKVQNWLTALTIKHKTINKVKLSHININDYKQLFELEDITLEIVIDVLTFLHLLIDDFNYFFILPQDIIQELFYHLDVQDILMLKQTCHYLNDYYQNIIKNNDYIKTKCQLLLLHYDTQQLNYNEIVHSYKILYKKPCQVNYVHYEVVKYVKHINFFTPIVKILIVDNDYYFLSSKGHLYYKKIKDDDHYDIVNINKFINDIIYHDENYFILSYGHVYFTNQFDLINKYSYHGRMLKTSSHDLHTLPIKNVIQICSYDNELLLLTIDGVLYQLNEDYTFDILCYNIKQISVENQFYILFKDNTLMSYKNRVYATIMKNVKFIYYNNIMLDMNNKYYNLPNLTPLDNIILFQNEKLSNIQDKIFFNNLQLHCYALCF